MWQAKAEQGNTYITYMGDKDAGDIVCSSDELTPLSLPDRQPTLEELFVNIRHLIAMLEQFEQGLK